MIYSVDPDLYKSGHLRPLSPIEVLGEFAKNRPGKKFPAAVICVLITFCIAVNIKIYLL